MKLLILDRDTDYLERFQYHLDKISKQRQGTVEIHIFNQIENVKQELSSGKEYDVILVDASFEKIIDDNFFVLISKSGFAYLSEENEIINNQKTIFKYNKVSKLYAELCKLYEEATKREMISVSNLL